MRTTPAQLAEMVRKARENQAKMLAEREAKKIGQAQPVSVSAAIPVAIANQPSTSNNSNNNSGMHLKPTITHHIAHALSNSVPSVTGIPLNENQQQAVELAMQGKSFNLCGAAGTGKTTTTREIIGQLVRLPHVKPLKASTKYLTSGDAGLCVVSFTNKAVNNIKRQLPDGLKHHCLTIHKLLEYQPVRAFDPYILEQLGWMTIGNDGKPKYSGMFLPSKNKLNLLPFISTLIIEESSMVDTDLFQHLLNALPDIDKVQFIFLGDLNQLPPIFGPSILGFKLTEQPTVELTHVYRQALQSPIITLAHRIREGLGFSGRLEDIFQDDRGEHGKVTIRPWIKKIDALPATTVILQKFLIPIVDSPTYDPNTTQFLCPFNKQLGTIALNKGIADHLTKKRGEKTYEVIARYAKSYWAVGDRVIVDKQDAVIVSIEESPTYDGALYQEASIHLDRYGKNHLDNEEQEIELEDGEEYDPFEKLYSSDLKTNGEETQNEASHIIKVEMVDTGNIIELTTAGQINSMILSYVITIHKSQGSEWDHVYLILHYSHNTMISRELMYTAVTRAKKSLFIVAEPDRGTRGEHRPNSITRAAKAPEIKGVTLAEKAEYFRNVKKTTGKAQPAAGKGEQKSIYEMDQSDYRAAQARI